MARASNEIDLGARQSVVEELGVGPGHHLVVGSGNNSDWCSNAWQELGEFRKVFAVALGVRDRVGEAIAFVARHVVFADLVRRRVARDGAQRDLDDLASADLAVGRQVGCFDPLLKNAGDVQWYRGSATADDDAAKSVLVGGGGKQHGGGPDVG